MEQIYLSRREMYALIEAAKVYKVHLNSKLQVPANQTYSTAYEKQVRDIVVLELAAEKLNEALGN